MRRERERAYSGVRPVSTAQTTTTTTPPRADTIIPLLLRVVARARDGRHCAPSVVVVAWLASVAWGGGDSWVVLFYFVAESFDGFS